jgi:hypothetical protein
MEKFITKLISQQSAGKTEENHKKISVGMFGNRPTKI